MQNWKQDFSSMPADAAPRVAVPCAALLACHHFSSNGTDRACSTSQRKQSRGQGIPWEKKNYTLDLWSLTSACTAEFAAPWGNNSRHLSLFNSTTIKLCLPRWTFFLYSLSCWPCKFSIGNGNISKLLSYPLRVFVLFRGHSLQNWLFLFK